MRCEKGVSMPEMLIVLMLLGVAVAVSVPPLARMRSSVRVAAAAREVAATFQSLRWQSVASGRAHGWLFERDAAGWSWRVVRDGNGNGLRTSEVRDGTDPVLAGPIRLHERIEGVDPGFPPGVPVRRIPPASGWLTPSDDPIRFGRSDLIAFSPRGSASSGTLYLSDGETLGAVVLFGPTSRLRVWSYDANRRRWRR